MIFPKDFLENYSNAYVLYDKELETLASSFSDGLPSLGISALESNKNLATVEKICRWLMDCGADRKALLIAIGGGCISDIGGFVAGIYKRGIGFAIVPTTLLSMVDASIGGKTGVNLDAYKNMIGVFHRCDRIFLVPEVLDSLPERQWREGSAEMLKTFLIRDAEGYERALGALHSRGETLMESIRGAAAIKKSIVEQDPLEHGLRKILNLGHSWAHAIEWKSQGGIPHGGAVAMGIVRAAFLSQRLGITKREDLCERIKTDFSNLGLPVEMPFTEKELLPAILKDKKAEGKGIDFVLLEDIGRAVIKNLTADDLLEHTK